MNDAAQCVFLHPQRRSITVAGVTTALQEKAWQVLSILIVRAPEIVTRAEIIDAVWSGNYLTGEKGLNQVLWTLRAAIGDDARQPRFIRTIPRVGYQWISGPVSRQQPLTRTPRYPKALAAGLGLVAVSIALALVDKPTLTNAVESGTANPVSVAANGTRAYLQDRQIVVDMATGCTRIVKPDQLDMELGNPAISTDGRQIVFPVRQGDNCKIVTIELENGARQDYGSCSLWSS